MWFEGVALKILSMLFKEAIGASAAKAIVGAVEVWSFIEGFTELANCVETANDCHDLGVCELKVISDPLTGVALERLVASDFHKFVLLRRRSGLYVAHDFGPELPVPSLEQDWQRLEAYLRSLPDKPLEADPSSINAVIDVAIQYERLASSAQRAKVYLPLAKLQYEKARDVLSEDANPELFCTVTYYLARLYMYAEMEALPVLGSMPIWEARFLLENILPVAERIQHPHLSELRNLYRQCLPRRLSGYLSEGDFRRGGGSGIC